MFAQQCHHAAADSDSTPRSPNLTIIDTPGLINAVPGRKNTNIQAAVRKELYTSHPPTPPAVVSPPLPPLRKKPTAVPCFPTQARAVEALVRSKMERRDFIILCLEDTSDWNNATTRRLVLQVDPELRRSVLVSTKFDTRIPQFSRAADVEMFIKPNRATLEATPLGGGPFFTSVPSGRVGNSRESLYRSNDHYREARLAASSQLSPALCFRIRSAWAPAPIRKQPRWSPFHPSFLTSAFLSSLRQS